MQSVEKMTQEELQELEVLIAQIEQRPLQAPPKGMKEWVLQEARTSDKQRREKKKRQVFWCRFQICTAMAASLAMLIFTAGMKEENYFSQKNAWEQSHFQRKQVQLWEKIDDLSERIMGKLTWEVTEYDKQW